MAYLTMDYLPDKDYIHMTSTEIHERDMYASPALLSLHSLTVTEQKQQNP
jgi:hypothetical protein